jgi:hypothetical protein
MKVLTVLGVVQALTEVRLNQCLKLILNLELLVNHREFIIIAEAIATKQLVAIFEVKFFTILPTAAAFIDKLKDLKHSATIALED